MKTILSNFFRLFLRNKGFLSAITLLPVVLFLVMSVLLAYNEVHSVAVINKTDHTAIEDTIRDMEGIQLQDVAEDDIASSLVSGVIDAAVVIETDPATNLDVPCIFSAGNTEVSGALELAIAKTFPLHPLLQSILQPNMLIT